MPGAVRTAFKALIVIVAEWHGDANGGQSPGDGGRGLAGATVHHASLVPPGQFLRGDFREDVQVAGIEYRAPVAEPHHRPLADECVRQGARRFQG